MCKKEVKCNLLELDKLSNKYLKPIDKSKEDKSISKPKTRDRRKKGLFHL